MCGSRHILPGSSLGAVSTFGIAIIGAEWRACKLPLLGVIVRNLPWHAATNELLQQINLAAPLSLSLQFPFSPSLRLWLCFSFHFAFVSLKISTRKWRRRRISARFLEHPIKSQINVMTTTKMSISDKRDNTSQAAHAHTPSAHPAHTHLTSCGQISRLRYEWKQQILASQLWPTPSRTCPRCTHGNCNSGSTVAVAVAEAVATTVDVRNSQLALMKQQTHKIRN